jgi:subtilisin family serine protease
MELTGGKPEIKIGLIDGPVLLNHTNLSKNIREVAGEASGSCSQAISTACIHGTFVAGVLCGKRGSSAPAICPECTLLIRPIFSETFSENGNMPSATPEKLAEAIVETIKGGASVINLSAAISQPSSRGERRLEEALDYAAARGVIVVAAAGNQGTIGSSAITRHSWVIPVIACDNQGRPLSYSNLGSSIGRRGLSAPGDNITSLGTNGKSHTFGGTSAAAPFVTGTIALLWSLFSNASAARLKFAVTHANTLKRNRVVPPLLDATASYQILRTTLGRS